jgi:hypothetical protein
VEDGYGIDQIEQQIDVSRHVRCIEIRASRSQEPLALPPPSRPPEKGLFSLPPKPHHFPPKKPGGLRDLAAFSIEGRDDAHKRAEEILLRQQAGSHQAGPASISLLAVNAKDFLLEP